MTDMMELILTIVAGVLTCIPLVIKLVEYVKKAINEKDWNRLVALVSDLMANAEDLFETGEERKEWILNNIEELAAIEGIRCEIDITAVGKMIDALCLMAKQVNTVDVVEEEVSEDFHEES